MTVIPFIIFAFETIHKGLLKGLKDLEIRRHVWTIQTIGLLRSAKIPNFSLRAKRDKVSFKRNTDGFYSELFFFQDWLPY